MTQDEIGKKQFGSITFMLVVSLLFGWAIEKQHWILAPFLATMILLSLVDYAWLRWREKDDTLHATIVRAVRESRL